MLCRDTAATYLINHGVEVLIDDIVSIAHNKVIIIDDKDVITGSFKFTRAAQKKNAENVLLITDDAKLADAYTENWTERAILSSEYHDFREEGR